MANTTQAHESTLLHYRHVFSTSTLISQQTVVAIFTILTISLIWQGFQRRKFYKGLPGPPHSILFGHLPSIIEATGKYPADAHPAAYFAYLLNKYNLWSKGLVYIDTYPLVNDNLLIATTPEAAAEITERNFPRHPFMTNFYGRVVGIKSISLAEGQKWKELRKTFNPGFSLTNIMTLMPEIVKQSEIFVDKLSAIAKNGGFVESLDELARGVTLDIIFRVVLGQETNTQIDPQGNEVGNLLELMSHWMGNPQSMNPLKHINLPRAVILRWNEWKIKKILSAEILKRWELVKENQAILRHGGKGPKELKLIIDLALKQYCDENAGDEKKLNTLSNDYLDTLSDNIKAFIFGGHDTTASTISYTVYELSRNPDILELVRKEHTDMFGSDLDAVPILLLEQPHLINQLPITIAIIKETLRLYPPAGALRIAEKGSTLVLPNTHKPFPLTSQLIWVAHPVMFRSPLEFPNPDLFLPQRFLPADFPLHPPSVPSTSTTGNTPSNPHSQTISPLSYRPFERGPRNCIGQELAMVELKIVLVLLLRRFAFREAYDELALRKGRKVGIKGGKPAVEEADGWGNKAYLVSLAISKAKDGIPVWVEEEVAMKE